MSVVITILIFGFIILIHEYGHFIVAKKCGVFIEEFAIGLGTRLFSWEKNGTIYSVRLLPLGGFCKMKGEDKEDKSQDSFNNVSVFKKILIVFAGAFMNFLLASIIFIGFAFVNGFVTTEVKSTLENYPAKEAGVQAGDIIYRIDGRRTYTNDDINYYINQGKSETLNIDVKRDGKILKFSLNKKYDASSGRYVIGVSMLSKSPFFGISSGDVKADFFESLLVGFYDMVFAVKITILGLLDIITLNIPVDSLTGPIGLTPVIGETYRTSLATGFSTMLKTMLNIMAILSANIGIMNLLPIPALDGGRLVFLFIELLRGKAVSQEKEGLIHFIGFAVLMAFGLLIAFKDIVKIF